MHPVISQVTERIRERSAGLRADYISRMQDQAKAGRPRSTLACGNLAHVLAACPHALIISVPAIISTTKKYFANLLILSSPGLNKAR